MVIAVVPFVANAICSTKGELARYEYAAVFAPSLTVLRPKVFKVKTPFRGKISTAYFTGKLAASPARC